MKVGVNARTFVVDEPGGAVQTAIRHTKGLISRSDTEVKLFGHGSLRSAFPETHVVSTGYSIPSQAYGLLWERIVLPVLADRHGVDVLYCPNGNSPAIRTPCPVVLCIHDVSAIKQWSSGVHQLYRRLAVPCAVALADTVVTVSEFSKREIIEQLNVPPSKLRVVHNGIDDVFLSEGEGEHLNLPEEYLLFVGSMNPRKNIGRVIRAFVRAKQSADLTHSLVLIGPGNKRIFRTVDVDDREDIVSLGFVSKLELKYAYTNADVFVFPSLYEGFGLPPLEALACGTPVVASETTSLKELLREGCILVDPEDVEAIAAAIVKISQDDRLSAELAAEGRTYAQEFTWDRPTEQLHGVLADTTRGETR